MRPGIEVLLEARRDLAAGKRLGLVTNQTGVDSQGRSSIDLLHESADWTLVALFSPEHGIRGDAEGGARIASTVDRQTGLPIFSLYGETTRPTTAMLEGLDALLFDIQEIGTRVYTYIATLAEVMRAGAEHGIPVVVLDRPNPINGVDVDGNILDERFLSFVGPARLPMRYGLTIGELGRFFNDDLGIGADLTVVEMDGWRRDLWLDQTGLPWINPSPNMRSLTAATLYPGMVLLEGTNVAMGRGTDTPFEWAGAPWVDGDAWASRLGEARLPGVRFHPENRTPTASIHANQPCGGVRLEIEDRTRLRSVALGVAMTATARELYPDRFQFTAGYDLLAGTDAVRLALESGRHHSEIVEGWQEELDRFLDQRTGYLLY